jgi:predicted transposase/invertase (TIGR01784 family)
MSKNPIKPHDQLFKQVMSNPKAAKSFFKHYLPKDITNIADFSSLRQEKNDYYSEILGEGITDLLYSIKLNGKQEGFITVLIEHQSSIDKNMPFRIHKYILRICEDYKKKYPMKKFPIIYPIIYYTGSRQYDASTLIFDLFENKELAKAIMLSPIRLIDLNKIPDEELRKQQYSGLMLLAHKYETAKKTMDIVDYLEELMPVLSETLKRDINIFKDVLSYLLNVGESYRGYSKEYLIEKVVTLLPESNREDVMTIADQFREEGMQQGMQQGMQHEKMVICKRLLSKNLDVGLIAETTGLSLLDVQKLKSKL